MSDERKYNIAEAKDRYDTNLKNIKLTWNEIIEKLKEPVKTYETVEEYKKMDKTVADGIKDQGGFVGGYTCDGNKNYTSITSRDLITLDADYATPSSIFDIEKSIQYDALVYSTHKSTPEKPRFRLVIPLSRSVTPNEYEPIARKVAQSFNIEIFDTASYKLSQLMFYPSVSKDGQYIFQVFDKGKVLNPDDILNTYKDYLDTTEYPYSSKENAKSNYDKKKVEDPIKKKNIVGALCNVYTITDAISSFLSDIYKPTRKSDRYDYIPADAKNGVQVFDNKFLYSHHSTDPAHNQLLNAFDLVRVAMFASLDEEYIKENANKKIKATSLPSYKKMCDFALEDEKVREYAIKNKLGVISFECADWIQKLIIDPKSSKVVPTLENLQYILANDPKIKNVRYNAFLDQCFAYDLPWQMEKPPTWSNSDEDQLLSYLSYNYTMFTDRIVKIAFSKITHDRMYHPVKEYFESLPEWDNVPRLDTLFIDYLGADDNVYVKEATRKTIVAVVSRIYEPGRKFDEVLVLSGEQGIGKSTIFSKLAREWFSDSLSMNDMKDKTAAEKLQGFIILEIAELAGMKKIEIETLKSFVTRQDDKFRPAYGRVVESHKRQCVIVGTTNKEEFLRDVTGNRRFWCITCKSTNRKSWDLTDSDVDQIWAEAIYRYKHKESLELSNEAKAIAFEVQRESMEEDGREGMVEEYLNMPLPNNWYDLSIDERREKIKAYQKRNGEVAEWTMKREYVTNQEIWAECFGKDLASIKGSDIFSIKSIIQKIGGWERSDKSRRMYIYGKQKYYERIP